MTLTISIPLESAHQRLDKALHSVLLESGKPEATSLSRVRVQALLSEGHVTQAGKPINDASRKVVAGEVFEITIPPLLPAEPEAQNIPLTIVYEDDDVIVIDKPAGLVVHPAPGNRDRTLVNALLSHCGDSLSGVGGVARPGIVHRLDKDTSGLMVAAKHDQAHQALAAQFADRSLSRTYQALVWGVPIPLSGEIDAPIGRHPRDRVRMAVVQRGKPAQTRYRVLNDYEIAALVECKLATGRTHQIRVHLSHLKHPVIGDALYGGKATRAGGAFVQKLRQFPRQALHAAALQFIHPVNGKTMRFASKLPEDMRKALAELKKAYTI